MAATIFVAMALAAIPTASADDCTVTVTLVGGQQLVFHVNVAPGTPISAMGLPITGPVASESEQCTPTSTTTGPTPLRGSAPTRAGFMTAYSLMPTPVQSWTAVRRELSRDERGTSVEVRRDFGSGAACAWP